MKIITAADSNYKEMLIASMDMNSRQGYESIVYDLGGLGFGKPWDITADMQHIQNTQTPYTGTHMMKAPFKPRIILDALLSHPDEDRLAWIDADAYCIQQIHMIMYRKVWDIAVTMRRPTENVNSEHRMFDGYINSGVILLRNNQATRDFIQLWIDTWPTAPTLVDQEALNMVLHADKMKEINVIYQIGNVKVMLLSTDEYNFYYFPDEPHEYTKVLHFKGMKENMQKYFNQYLNYKHPGGRGVKSLEQS
jgi:hypothetical protein